MSIKIEEKGIYKVNENYQTQGKEKEKTNPIEKRKKQAQKDAMKIAHDTWEEGYIIEHKLNKEEKNVSVINRERMENIEIEASPKQEERKQIEESQLEPSKIMEISAKVKSEKPERAEVMQAVRESGKVKSKQTTSIVMEAENVKVESDINVSKDMEILSEKEDTKNIKSESESNSMEDMQNISEQKTEKAVTEEKETYFDKIVAEQKKDEEKKSAIREELLKAERQEEMERKELQKDLEKEELAKAEREAQIEEEQEKRELRREELLEELQEDMTKTLEKMAVIEGIQSGVYDKVEHLLDERILLKEDVKGIIIDQNF